MEDGPIDIMFLIERLEELLEKGTKLPMTDNVVVDKQKALTFIDEMRAAIPEEVRAAKRITAEGERIVERAEEEAERIIARAQEQAAFLIDERGLTQAAREEGERILAEGRRQAEEIRRGADDYAESVLVGLEGDLVRTLESVKRGIAMLDQRLDEGAEQTPITDAEIEDLGPLPLAEAEEATAAARR